MTQFNTKEHAALQLALCLALKLRVAPPIYLWVTATVQYYSCFQLCMISTIRVIIYSGMIPHSVVIVESRKNVSEIRIKTFGFPHILNRNGIRDFQNCALLALYYFAIFICRIALAKLENGGFGSIRPRTPVDLSVGPSPC